MLLPGFTEAKAAASAAGALGCSISGAGPTSFALVDGAADRRASGRSRDGRGVCGRTDVAATASVTRRRPQSVHGALVTPTCTDARQRCDDCGHELDELDPRQQCPECQGLLAVMHATPAALDMLRSRLDTNRSPSGVWRFGEIVLPTAVGHEVSHPEGTHAAARRCACSAHGAEPTSCDSSMKDTIRRVRSRTAA